MKKKLFVLLALFGLCGFGTLCAKKTQCSNNVIALAESGVTEKVYRYEESETQYSILTLREDGTCTLYAYDNGTELTKELTYERNGNVVKIISSEDNYIVVVVDDETMTFANYEEEETDPNEEDVEDYNWLEDISQTAYDIIVIIREFCNQPLTIFGVSTTIGAFALSILMKALYNIFGKSKKNKETFAQIEEIANKMLDEKTSREELAEENKKLKACIIELAKSNKNIKVKENVLALVEETKPVVNEVVEDTKEFAKEEMSKAKSQVLDILDK